MTPGRFIARSLRYYWRTNLGVAAGVAIAAAILTGALAVGDSMRASLRRAALARLGATQQALVSQDRFFRAALADEIQPDLRATVAPLLLLRGSVVTPDESARANAAQIVGVEDRFWKLGGASNGLAGAAAGEAIINERLAAQLSAGVGTTIVVRVEQPPMISRDAPLSGESSLTVEFRVRVRAIAGNRDFGRFGLRAEQTPPFSVFVPLPALQEQLQRAGQGNVLLTDSTGDAAAALRKHWRLADAGLEARTINDGKMTELRTPQIFLPSAAASAALALSTNAAGVLTYFANDICRGSNYTPYSFVAASGSVLRDDEITINSWTAEDLGGAKAGDELTLKYYVIGQRRELREESAKFRVREIIPVAKDESWMPAFPGLADKESCGDWKPGIPINHDHMRSQDGDYWTEFHGTPKAFVSLAAGQKMWSNRFGNLTAVRYPAGDVSPADFERLLIAKIDPAQLGLAFVPVREAALAASGQSMDFGQLFIGFSFFLIVAALLLSAMLFVFNLEQRHREIGLLKSLGFGAKQVRRFFVLEGGVLATAGTLAGIPAGVLYTKFALLGLSTVWRGAVGAIEFEFHVEASTLLIGAGASLFSALAAMWIVQRAQFRRAPVELLSGDAANPAVGKKSRGIAANVAAFGGLLGAIALLGFGASGRSPDAAGTFFGAGSCLLISGIGFSRRLFGTMTTQHGIVRSLATIGRRNASRRSGRSLTTIGVLASGIFMVVAIGAFQHDPRHGALERKSGTGGFALFARATLPIYDDLNSDAGRETFGLSAESMNDVAIVALRMREGDDASCLNLNRAQQPTIWGVNPGELESRHAFKFAMKNGSWSMLSVPASNDVVNGIGDEATVTWALGKKVGDTIPMTGDDGKVFQIRIAGVLSGSILQGGLLISETNFIARFPSASGFRTFLIDAPPATAGAVEKALSQGLKDRGFEVAPAWRRLAELMEVENTYLAVFQALGGLGLLLGSAGFGIVVMRNTLERRRELAVMEALGFERYAIRRMVFNESALLISLGMAIGIIAAGAAIAPALLASGDGIPVWGILVLLAGLAIGGFIFCWLAVRAALRGPLIGSLRNE